MRRPVRVMDADTPQRRGRSVHLPVPHGPTAWKSPMVVVEPDSTVSRSRGSVMLRPFYETLGEETPSGERPPPRSQPDQHDQALCELARGGRRQVHADPTRLEVLALSSSSRNPEPTPPMDHPNRLVGGSSACGTTSEQAPRSVARPAAPRVVSNDRLQVTVNIRSAIIRRAIDSG